MAKVPLSIRVRSDGRVTTHGGHVFDLILGVNGGGWGTDGAAPHALDDASLEHARELVGFTWEAAYERQKAIETHDLGTTPAVFATLDTWRNHEIASRADYLRNHVPAVNMQTIASA